MTASTSYVRIALHPTIGLGNSYVKVVNISTQDYYYKEVSQSGIFYEHRDVCRSLRDSW